MRLLVTVAVVFVCLAEPAVAQNGQSVAFNDTVESFAASGKARIYQCKNAAGRFDPETQHPKKLLGVAHAMADGDEALQAKQAGCLEMVRGKSQIYSGDQLLAPGFRTSKAVWLIGEVTNINPGATGYTFQAIIRIPIGVTVPSPESKAYKGAPRNDATRLEEAYRLKTNGRPLPGSDEDSGYFVCPTQEAVKRTLDIGAAAALKTRTTRIDAALRANQCKLGSRLLTGIRPNRMVQADISQYYGALGFIAGKMVQVVLYYE